MANVLFALKGVRYSYHGKVPALCGIDLSIEEGSKVALIGANGTGKSTLLTMLNALIFPEEGSVQAFGRELHEGLFSDAAFCRSFRRRVGFVFQNPDVQLFCPTVREEIAFGPLQLGVPKQEVRKRLERLAADLRIGPLLERPPHRLSIGEKRRVALASILAVDPDVLLLDEPTAGLDPRTTRDILDILWARNEAGQTIVTATHDLHIVDEIADEVHVLGADRRISRSAPPADVLSDLDFLRAHNLVHMHGHRHGGRTHIHAHSPLERHQAPEDALKEAAGPAGAVSFPQDPS